jgi:iron complex outermembrane recepter protein
MRPGFFLWSRRYAAAQVMLHTAGSTDPQGVTNPNLSNDPDYQWLLRASADLAPNHQLDISVRQVGELPNPVVPEYTAVDLRYGWNALRDLEFSLTVRNAFDAEHAEFGPATNRSEIARDLYAQIRWSF